MEERLQKIIARAGLASRRRAEEMIRSGLVTVNGQVVTKLGSKAESSRDHIKVAGKLLRPEAEPAHVYLILNKPPEVVATMSDPEGRQSLRDLLYGVPERVFPVGRLEYHSSGLVFLTNDGELANQMLKARNLQQTYQFKVKSLLTFAEIEELSRSTGARITRIIGKDMPWYLVTLADASRDALRGKLFRTGHPVEKIRRVSLAGIELGSLASGQHRALSGEELSNLRRALVSSASGARGARAAAPAPLARPAPRTKPASRAKRDPRTKPARWTKPNQRTASDRPAKSGPWKKPEQQTKPAPWARRDSRAKAAPWAEPDSPAQSNQPMKPNQRAKPGQWPKSDQRTKPGQRTKSVWTKPDSHGKGRR